MLFLETLFLLCYLSIYRSVRNYQTEKSNPFFILVWFVMISQFLITPAELMYKYNTTAEQFFCAQNNETITRLLINLTLLLFTYYWPMFTVTGFMITVKRWTPYLACLILAVYITKVSEKQKDYQKMQKYRAEAAQELFKKDAKKLFQEKQ